MDGITQTLIIALVLAGIVISGGVLNLVDKGKSLYVHEIDGTWRRAGNDPETNENWYIEYTFSVYHQQFKVQANPDLNGAGSYRVINETEKLLTVELYNTVGENANELNNNLLHIAVNTNPENTLETLHINGLAFGKVMPSV